MASAMATAATRSIPIPYTIPVGPRIRPPRLLPGTKAANTDPKPDEPPPTAGDVWVQGKWRNPRSRAARDRREVQSAKTEKALRHVNHGRNIYAYSHIRTNQVVYSLTRIMQNNKILPQLLYYGKQTVPASLRRDLWRPYFSIHFPETPAGTEAGLKAYQRLRELAVQRQLSPPPGYLIATEEDVKKSEKRYDPLELKYRLKNDNIKHHPTENQLLPQRLRARKLMDQKATSVADAAFVLEVINQETSPEEEWNAALEAREQRYQKMSKRAMQRLGAIKQQEAAKEVQISQNQDKVAAQEGDLGLTLHTARRIALEYGGAVSSPSKGVEYMVKDVQPREKQDTSARQMIVAGESQNLTKDEYKDSLLERWKNANSGWLAGLSEEDAKKEMAKEQWNLKTQVAAHDWFPPAATPKQKEISEAANGSRNVQVLWADVRDATWAENWSSNVFHGELEQRAALKHERLVPQQGTTIDGDGNEVPQQEQRYMVQESSTPHIFGTNSQAGWYESPKQFSEKQLGTRDSQLAEWRDAKFHESKKIVESMKLLNERKDELLRLREEVKPEFNAYLAAEINKTRKTPLNPEQADANTVFSNYTEDEKYALKAKMQELEEKLKSTRSETGELERSYPSLHNVFKDLLQWHQGQIDYIKLIQLKDELESIKSDYKADDPAAVPRLEETRRKLESYASSYPPLTKLNNTQFDPQTTIYDLGPGIVQEALRSIQEQDAYRNTSILDLVFQLEAAKQSDNTEVVERLTQEMSVIEDDWLLERLGLGESNVEATVTEVNEEKEARDREKGIEQPPPVQPSRGLVKRVMGLFGR